MSEEKKTGVIPVWQGAVILTLCALWPVLDFGVRNMTDQDFRPPRLLFYFLIFLAAGVAAGFGLKFLLRQRGAGAAFMLAGIGVFAVLNYYLISGALQQVPGLGNYALIGLLLFILLLAGASALFVWPRTQPVIPALAIAMLFGLGAVTLQNSFALGRHLFFTEAGRSSLSEVALRSDKWPSDPAALNENSHYKGAADAAPPNIYYILPDMLMGAREFEAMTGAVYEMDEILEKRNFKVLDHYYSNAPITRLSLAHVFGADYFADKDTTLTNDLIRNLPWRDGGGVYQTLRRRGYNIFYFVDTYVNPDCAPLADYCYTKKNFFDAQDLIFLERTPFFEMLTASGSTLAPVWRRLMKYPYYFEIPEILNTLPKKGASPSFTYLHFGLPHSPYRFDEKCEYYDAYPPIREDKLNGSIQAYVKQVKCAEKMYSRLIDQILKNDPDAWIIFQADHGVNYYGQSTGENIMTLSEEQVAQNLSIMGAYRLPERCLDTIPEDMSPVNTFPVLLACLDGRAPELKPAHHYLMYYLSWQPDGQVRDVTEIIRARADHLK